MKLIIKVLKHFMPEKLNLKYRVYTEKQRLLFKDKEFITYVYRKRKALEFNRERIETLSLRGSHADYATYATEHNRIFNLGLTSSDIYINYQLYKNVASELPNLKSVLFFYSVFTPGMCLEKTKEKNRMIAYKYFFDVPYQEAGNISISDEKQVFRKCKRIEKTNIDYDYFGYDKKNFFITNSSVEDRVRTHIRENSRTPNQVAWLEKLFELTKENSHDLYIIIPPAKASYYQSLPEKNTLFTSIQKFKKQGVNIIDLYGSEYFDDSDFGDFDHMNEKGAIKLTKLISTYLNN
ncbi:hypothetical protein AB4353_17305 [Vibrio breoganii]